MKNEKDLSWVEKLYLTQLLCDRLCYRTKALVVSTGEVINVSAVRVLNDHDKHENAVVAIVESDKGIEYRVENVRPYLRSLTTLTKGELDGLKFRTEFGCISEISEWPKLLHLDTSDYIKKGLAIEAPEDMPEYVSGMGTDSNTGLI